MRDGLQALCTAESPTHFSANAALKRRSSTVYSAQWLKPAALARLLLQGLKPCSTQRRCVAVGRKHERVRLVSETQDLWPTVGRGWKFGADCRACDRLSFPLSGAISTFDHSCRRCHGRGLGSPVFLLPRHRPLGCRTNSRHSLRFLYRRRDRKSRRLARWTPLVVRTSSFFWSADGEALHAKSQPDCQGDYVVCGSDVFRGCPKPGCVLGLALGRSWEQAVFSICARMGGGNVGK